MSNDQYQEIVRRFYDAWDKGDWDAVSALFADNVVDHNATPDQAPGRKGLVEGLMAYTRAFPDLKFTVDRIFTDGDKVVDNGWARATHKGDLFGIPATNKPVQFNFTDIYRIVNGKIAEVWHIEDIAGVMQQIGAMPNAPTAQPPSQTARGTRSQPGMSTPPM